MTRRTRGIAFLVALLMLAARTGAAQSPPDPLETAMIRFGPLGINPSIVLRDFGVDNNVFNEPDNPKSDFTFTLTPRADFFFHPRGVRLTLTTASDMVYYETYTTERSTNNLLQAGVQADLWRFQPFASVRALDTRARYNQEIDVRAHHRDLGYTAGVTMRLSTRTTFTVTGKRNELRFDNGEAFRGEDLSVTMNSTTDVLDGALGFELTPITTLALSVSSEQQRFEYSPDRNSDTLRVTPTLTFTPDGLLSGAVSVGYRRFTPRSSDLPPYSGAVAAVKLAATLFGRNRIDGGISRDLKYSYEAATPYYLSTAAQLTWTVKLAGPFDVKLTGRREAMDYRAAADVQIALPHDVSTAYGGGVGYAMRDDLHLGVEAEWSQRASELSTTRNYNNRRIFATVTWGKP